MHHASLAPSSLSVVLLGPHMQMYISDAEAAGGANNGTTAKAATPSKYSVNRYLSLTWTSNQGCPSTCQVDLKIAIFYPPAFEEVMTFLHHEAQKRIDVDCMALIFSCLTQHPPPTPNHTAVCYGSNGLTACFEQKQACQCHDAALTRA